MGKFSESYQWDEDKDKKKPPSEHPFSDVMKPHQQEEANALSVYRETVAFCNDIFEKGKTNQPVSGAEILHRVNELIDNVLLSSREFLEFVAKDSTKEDYRARHIANVTILSIKIGSELGLNKSKLSELGVGALLHDMGIARVADLEAKPRKLSPEEYEKMRQHPTYGVEFYSTIKDLSSNSIYCTIQQHHERLDGTGYPKAIKDGEITKHAQIVGILDMYEAMTHYRPHRGRKSSYEAMKILLATGANQLEPRYVEALVNVIGLYPVGSWVELNTGEIAKVLEVNKKRPLRPTVNIIYDARGVKLLESRPVDISTHPIIFIKKVLNDEDLKQRFPK